MARKLPIRTVRFFTLLTVKEGYLTCRNFLGLFYHPFKTIKVIGRERDPLQILLIFGLPFYLWIGGVTAILVGRFLVKTPLLPLGTLAKVSLIIISFFAGAVFSYLGYWLIKIIRSRYAN